MQERKRTPYGCLYKGGMKVKPVYGLQVANARLAGQFGGALVRRPDLSGVRAQPNRQRNVSRHKNVA